MIKIQTYSHSHLTICHLGWEALKKKCQHSFYTKDQLTTRFRFKVQTHYYPDAPPPQDPSSSPQLLFFFFSYLFSSFSVSSCPGLACPTSSSPVTLTLLPSTPNGVITRWPKRLHLWPRTVQWSSALWVTLTCLFLTTGWLALPGKSIRTKCLSLPRTMPRFLRLISVGLATPCSSRLPLILKLPISLVLRYVCIF